MAKLHELLRSIEHEGKPITPADLESRVRQRTSYKGLATYRSKYLDGVLIHDDGHGWLSVRGAIAMSPNDFGILLSQRKEPHPPRLQYATQDEWAQSMRELAEYGLSHSFQLGKEDEDLFLDSSDTCR